MPDNDQTNKDTTPASHTNGEGEAWMPERGTLAEMEARFGPLQRQHGMSYTDGRSVELFVFEKLYVLLCCNPENEPKLRYYQAQLSPESMFAFRFMYDFLCHDNYGRDEIAFREVLPPDTLEEWDRILRESFAAGGVPIPEFKLADIYTEEEVGEIGRLYNMHESSEFRTTIINSYIEPNRERITASIGEFDAQFIAYATEHIFTTLVQRRRHEQPAGTTADKSGR
jgi:hypothetical protein